MIRFITPKNNIVSLNNGISEIDPEISPIKEILKKNDFSNYFFVPDEDDNNKIQLSETYQLQVNVKCVGTFHFLIKVEGFDKQLASRELSGLKDMNVDNAESAKYKVAALINMVKNYNPLFCIFKEDADTYYYSYELEGAVNHQFPVFIVRDEQDRSTYEFTIGDNQYEELAASQDKKAKVYRFSKDRIIKDLLKNKFSLLLIFISTILMEVSIPLAIMNVYAKNALYIFLFICGVIGVMMNVYCYYDYFKSRYLKHPLFFFNIASNFLGIGVGIGLFAIFYHISTKAEGTPGLGSFILMGLLIALIIISATIAVIYFIPRKNKKR